MKRPLFSYVTALALLSATLEIASAAGTVDLPSMALGGATCFTNPFVINPTPPLITVEPVTNMHIFYAGEPVTLKSPAPMTVSRLVYGNRFATVTNGPDSIHFAFLPAGQYFVQSANDRAEFAVLPANYSKLASIGHNADYLQEPYIHYADRAKLGWVRATLEWGEIQTNGAGAINWSGWVSHLGGTDVNVSRITNWLPRAKIILFTGKANHTDPKTGADINWAFDYSPERYCDALSNFLVAAHARYGGNTNVVALDVLSEASNQSVNKNLNVRDYSRFAGQLYAAVAAAWPGVMLIGPSESSVGSAYPQLFKRSGIDRLLNAVDYHDYSIGYGNEQGDPDFWQWGVIARVASNTMAMGQARVFVTELGLLGGSALGNTN